MRVTVIGGGAIGLSAAWHAARLGATVTVVEAGVIAGGSSGLSAGIFNRQTTSELELELRIRSADAFADLERRHGIGLIRCGYARLAADGDALALLAAVLDRQRALGYDGGRLVDPDELSRLVPGMRCDDLAGALYGADDGVLDGHLLCAAYAAEARTLGVEIRTGRPFDPCDGADRVINAAGPHAARVAETLGVRVPLLPQRHALLVAHLAAPAALPTVNEYLPGAATAGLYFRPEGSDRLLCGLHTYAAADPPADPDAFARTVSFDEQEAVAERLSHRLSGLGEVRLEPGWAGLYPVSPDGRFIVGPHPERPDVIAAAGCGGVGLTVSPLVGLIAAEWAVLGDAPSFRGAPALLPRRFG